jgi:hypothetical protein
MRFVSKQYWMTFWWTTWTKYKRLGVNQGRQLRMLSVQVFTMWIRSVVRKKSEDLPT